MRRTPPAPPATNRPAPVAQLDRVLPSEGRGHRFESCRVRQLPLNLLLLRTSNPADCCYNEFSVAAVSVAITASATRAMVEPERERSACGAACHPLCRLPTMGSVPGPTVRALCTSRTLVNTDTFRVPPIDQDVGAAAFRTKQATVGIPGAPKGPGRFTNVKLFEGKFNKLIEGKPRSRRLSPTYIAAGTATYAAWVFRGTPPEGAHCESSRSFDQGSDDPVPSL